MAQFDTLLIDGGFAIGSTDYDEHYPNDWQNTRIVVTVLAGGYARSHDCRHGCSLVCPRPRTC